MKYYEYRVYTSASVFITNWTTEVISDFAYSQEINSAGSQLLVTLARPADNFGEGSDVTLNNRVRVFGYNIQQDYLQDESGNYITDESGNKIDTVTGAPNGAVLFDGFIADYAPSFGSTEEVQITILGYGAQLNNYMIETGEAVTVAQTTSNTDNTFGLNGSGNNQSYAQTFQFAAQTVIDAIEVRLKVSSSFSGTIPIDMNLYLGSIAGHYPTISGGPPAWATPTATVTHNVTGGISYTTHKFTFATAVTIPAATVYTFELVPNSGAAFGDYVNLLANNTSVYANGASYFTDAAFTPTYTADGGDLWFNIYTTSGSTTSTYSSQDPGTILASIMTDYANKGGHLATSIDLTGTSVSYTFNTNTTLEGVQKCLELAPDGWYWYVDQAFSTLHFHKQGTTANHSFTVGKEIANLTMNHRSENVINTIYFTGSSLYKKYTNQTSINTYGPKLLRYTDQRVTLSATADTIANAILDGQSVGEVRIDGVEIFDRGVQPLNGYNIESIVIGQMATFVSTGTAAITVQIVRYEYTPSSIKLYMSTIPPDVNKRVEDISRNLELTQTASNPSAPS